MFAQFEALSLDKHPNAHALRLKLNLTLALVPGLEFSWKLEAEMTQYLVKWTHVSKDCRLTLEEEVRLMELIPGESRHLELMSLRWSHESVVSNDSNLEFNIQHQVRISHQYSHVYIHIDLFTFIQIY